MGNELMGIINLSEPDEMLNELTIHRSVAAIPFAGRYRIIDFQLSNMVNSGIELVSIFTKDKFRSLQDHLESGKCWNLDRKRDGLYIFYPMINYNEPVIKYGDMEIFKSNVGFIKRSKQKYVLISKSHMVTNIDYSNVLEFHKESNSDITMIYKQVEKGSSKPDLLGLDILTCDGKGNVTSIGKNLAKMDTFPASLEMYMMKKDLLVDIIEDAIEKGDSGYLKEAVMKRLPELNVNCFEHKGETFCINSIHSFYNANMALLNREIFTDLFKSNGKIYTKIKDEPSTKYTDTSCVTNSILANGSIIEGTVENSIIFRKVHIKKGAIVRNSIIMQGSVIGETVNINCVIADKNVTIKDKKILMGDVNTPFVIKKNTTL